MQRICIAMLAMAALAACGDSGQPLAPPTEGPRVSAQTETTSEFIQVLFTQFVPCANGGAGEDVLIEGTIHQVFHATQTESGQFRIVFHENPRGLKGTGLTTGDVYKNSGSITFSGDFFIPVPGASATLARSFLLIGPGTDNNFRIHETFHITTNANGEVTSEVENTSVTCD